MKIVIAGCGKVGQKIVEKLSCENEHDITVIDTRQKVLSEVIGRFDVMGVCGNCASLETLEDAGVADTDILITVTGSDELNLLTCLIANKLCSCKTIARVRKPEYGKSIHLFKEDLGLAMVINPELAAASEIARALRFPSAISIDTFSKGRVEILKFKVLEGSPLCDMKISDLNQKLSVNILVCGVERKDEAFIPDGNFIIKENDVLSIVSSLEDCAAFFKRIGIKESRVKDTIIVGGGEIAYYLSKILEKSGIKVKIFEKNTERASALCELLPKAEVINADGTEKEILLQEGIEYADSFVALTNMDEENILLSLFAKSKTKGKLVTKINRIAYDEVIKSLDLDTTVYPKDITAEYIVKFVRAKSNSISSNIETMHTILDGKAEALEFRIKENSPISKIPLSELKLKKNIIIACITRKGKIIIPNGRDIIEPDDLVIIVTTHHGYVDISDILG